MRRDIAASRLLLFILILSDFGHTQDVAKPPYQRMLMGDDATRAQELSSKSDAAETSDDYQAAIRLQNELLELRSRVQGKDHWEAIETKWDLVKVQKLATLSSEERAEWRRGAESIRTAVQLESENMAARGEEIRRNWLQRSRRILGDEHPTTVASYNNLAQNLEVQGKYADAQSLHLQALDLAQRTLGPNHVITATCYNDLGSNLVNQGKDSEAQPYFERAIQSFTQCVGEFHENTAISLVNLGDVLTQQGQHSEAQPFIQKGLDVFVRLFGEKNEEALTFYQRLANNLQSQGKFVDAQSVYVKLLELTIQVHGQSHIQTGTTYNNLALNLNAQGKYAEAQQLFQKVLPIIWEQHGDEHIETAKYYANISHNLVAQGKYVEAQTFVQKSLDLVLDHYGESHPDAAFANNNFGFFLAAQEKYVEAQPFYQKALELNLRFRGEKHPYSAISYNNVGYNLYHQRKYEEAEPLYRKSLDLKVQVLGEHHAGLALSIDNLALNLSARGNYAEAAPLFQEGLEMRLDLLGKSHPHTATSYINVADNMWLQGELVEAIEPLVHATQSYEAARLDVATEGLDRATFGSLQSPYNRLAAVRARLGESTAAWEAAEADLARGLGDEIAARRGVQLSAEESYHRKRLSGQLEQVKRQFLPLLSQATPTTPEQNRLKALRAEYLNLQNQLAEHSVTASRRGVASLSEVQSAIPADAALVFWVDVAPKGNAIREHWGCVLRRTGSPNWEPLGRDESPQSKSRDATLAAKLRSALRTPTSAANDIEVLATALYQQRVAPLEKHLKGVQSLYVVSVREMAGIPVELLTDQFTVSYIPSGTFLARRSNRVASQESSILALGDPIFSQSQLSPVSTRLPPGGLLIKAVSPNGAAAAARLRARDVLLSYGDHELTSVDSLTRAIAKAQTQDKMIPLTVWRENVEKPFTRSVPPGKLDVALDSRPAPQAIAARRNSDAMLLTLRGREWNDLPGSRVEVQQIANLFGKHARILLDSAASEQSLDELRSNNELSRFRYLHFATHGEANQVRDLESALILANDALPESVLPQADRPTIDGRLAAHEVLQFWKLNAELVTLSACETAIGRDGGGDGLLGFAQAFLSAGSRSVCLSLWRVDDTATALLMARFYQNLLGQRPGIREPLRKAAALDEARRWLRELPAEQALRLSAAASNSVVRGTRAKGAKLELTIPASDSDPKAQQLRPFAHPKYWSAFVLIGDPD